MKRQAAKVLSVLACCTAFLAVSAGNSEAGVIPWVYNAIFGTGRGGGAYYGASYGPAYYGGYGGGCGYGGCGTGCCGTYGGGYRGWYAGYGAGYGGGYGGGYGCGYGCNTCYSPCGGCYSGCGHDSCGCGDSCGGYGCGGYGCGVGGCGVSGCGVSGCAISSAAGTGDCGVTYPATPRPAAAPTEAAPKTYEEPRATPKSEEGFPSGRPSIDDDGGFKPPTEKPASAPGAEDKSTSNDGPSLRLDGKVTWRATPKHRRLGLRPSYASATIDRMPVTNEGWVPVQHGPKFAAK